MTKAIDKAIQPAEAVTNEASMGDAKLDGVPGTGTLQVARGGQGDVLDVLGTWRLESDREALDVGRLIDAYRAGTSLEYEGKLDDPALPERKFVTAEVKISSVATYTYDTGEEKTLFNFRPNGDTESFV